MAENVVKNKIVIEGEAKYKQTLREISQQLKEAKSEVKATSAEMKAQGQTTETVRGKLDALSNVYKAQTEQLKTMQEHLEKVEAAYGENSREASELRTRINNLRAETSNTSGEMKTLEQQLDNMGDAAQGAKDDLQGLDKDLAAAGDAAGDAAGELAGLPGILGELGQGIDIGIGLSIGQGLLSGITGAIKAAAQMGLNEAIEDQKGYNLVGIQTGTLGTAYNDMMFEAMERLMLRQPKVSTEDASGFAASIWTRAAGTDYVKDADSFLDIMEQTYFTTQRTGQNFDALAEGAKNMSAAFGSDFRDNVILIGSFGQGNAAAKGLDTMEKYGFSFAALGMNAEEAASAISTASDKGIDDVGKYGKAVESLATWMKELTSETEGVEELGLLGDDLGKKFDQGGETAANAVDLVIDKLKGIKDTDLQNQLGEQIFGSQAWDRYGMNIADAILAGYGQEFLAESERQNKLAGDALTNDLESQIQIAGNVAKEAAGEIVAPVVGAVTDMLKGANGAAIEAFDSGGGIEAAKAWGKAAAESVQENVINPFAETTDQQAASLIRMVGYAVEDVPDRITQDWEEALAQVGDKAGLLDKIKAFGGQFVDGYMETWEQGRERLRETGPGWVNAVIDTTASALGSLAGFANEAGQGAATIAGNVMQDWDDAVKEAGENAGIGETVAAFGGNLLEGYTETWERGRETLREFGPAWVNAVIDTTMATKDKLGEAISSLFAGAEAEGAEAAEQAGAAAMQGYESGTQEQLDAVVARIQDLNEQIRMAYQMEDPILAENIKTQRDEAIQELNDLQAKMADEAQEAGKNLDEGFGTGAQGVTVTVEDTATGIITTLEPFVPQVLQQGTDLGIQLDDGFLKGAEPLPGDAQDTVDAMISKLDSAADRAYSSGRRAGEAFERGYKSALDQHSPSRVMQRAAEDTISPIIDTMSAGEGEIRSRADALGQAVAGGYAEGAGNGPVLGAGGLSGPGLAVDPAGIAEAVRAALTGLGVYLDGRPVGELAEPYVSEATSRRAAGTVRGVSAAAKGW